MPNDWDMLQPIAADLQFLLQVFAAILYCAMPGKGLL